VFQEGDMLIFFPTQGEFPCWHIQLYKHSLKEKKFRFVSSGGFYLKLKKYGPYIIVKKIHNNVHVVDLLAGMSIWKIFNIADSKTSCSQCRGLM
jgi:hypothetical protein